jgi:hypothetical protein
VDCAFPPGLRSDRVLLVHLRAWRQLNPGMPAAVVDRDAGRRKVGIGEGADADRPLLVAFLGVEDRGSADGAEAEPEAGALVAGAKVFGRDAGDLVGRGGSAESRSSAARASELSIVLSVMARQL